MLRWCEARGIGYAISADMSRELAAAIRALPEESWRHDADEAVREWGEVAFVPDDGVFRKDAPVPRRSLALRVRKEQGALFADGSDVRHFCIVTNRPDPDGGSGL